MMKLKIQKLYTVNNLDIIYFTGFSQKIIERFLIRIYQVLKYFEVPLF
jgi:hypothetical protein